MLASLKAISSFFSLTSTPPPSAGTSQAPPPPAHLAHSTHHQHSHPHPQGCLCRHHHHHPSHAAPAVRWHAEEPPTQPHYSPFTEHFLQESRRRDFYAPYPSPIRTHDDYPRCGTQPSAKKRCTRCRRLKGEVDALREQVWALTMQVRSFQQHHQSSCQPQYLISGKGEEPVIVSGRTPMKRRRSEMGDEEDNMILWAPKKKAAWLGTTTRHVQGRTASHPWQDDASSMSSDEDSASSSFSTPGGFSSSRSSSDLLQRGRRRPSRPISPISWEQDVQSGSERAQGRYRSPTPYAWYSPPSSPSPYTPAALLVHETALDLPMDGTDDEGVQA